MPLLTARAAAIALDTPPMEARAAEALPVGDGWQFEPKWDGFRCLAFRTAAKVELMAKSGKPLTRFFPEIANALAAVPSRHGFVVDGELVIAVNGKLSFEALQMRLHPAQSRIERLSRETPARIILFDCLMDPRGKSVAAAPLTERRAALEAFFAAADSPALDLTPFTRDRAIAQGWLDHLTADLDGIVYKRLDGPYVPGARTMLKVIRIRTADCVVGGFRYGANSKLVGSLLLGLYNDKGLLDHVGFTSGLSGEALEPLTRRLESLVSPPGFTGDAPGAPSRWSSERSVQWQPLKPELVVEVRYDHVSGGRFRHGTGLVRWRSDKAPSQCTMEQISPAIAQRR